MKSAWSIHITGTVQGVGFRPFVFRLATEMGLVGWVNNSTMGVHMEIEAEEDVFHRFIKRLKFEKPQAARIGTVEYLEKAMVGYTGFTIRESTHATIHNAAVLPDLATCPDCRNEIFDPNDRRYRYPFTNCTNCGPRFSILKALPYDRKHTTMAAFEMCSLCLKEYQDPRNRRFHAQPNACPQCGPQLELKLAKGEKIAEGIIKKANKNIDENIDEKICDSDSALAVAIDFLKQGKILALKGLGGFQLIVDANNEAGVSRLRTRKGRMSKPFAVMFKDLEALGEWCEFDSQGERLLMSQAAPIVLLKKKKPLAKSVAPNNPYLGAFLPTTPLHHLLLQDFDGPLVVTSGNLSEDPICIDNDQALETLGSIADVFLMHNRPVHRHVDDSVVKIVAGATMMLRRSRGYAPEPFELEEEVPDSLCVGGHLKNTIAVTKGKQVFLSQHLGDLSTPESIKAFESEVLFLTQFYQVQPEWIVRDAHPEYFSSLWCQKRSEAKKNVWHHEAHVFATIAEHKIQSSNQLSSQSSCLCVSWDGTGYGQDHQIWGGEFYSFENRELKRIGSLRPFPLLGGEMAAKEPRRVAFSLIMTEFGNLDYLPLENYSTEERDVFAQMFQNNLQLTTSVGRLCEGVSSLLGLRHFNEFEAQSAMELEFSAEKTSSKLGYSFQIHKESSSHFLWDWGPALREGLGDLKSFCDQSLMANKFLLGMAQSLVLICKKLEYKNLVLGGGVFQNKVLVEAIAAECQTHQVQVFFPQLFPPNDGGIALGQAYSLLLKG